MRSIQRFITNGMYIQPMNKEQHERTAKLYIALDDYSNDFGEQDLAEFLNQYIQDSGFKGYCR